MSEDHFEQAADELCDLLIEFDEVDLNALEDYDVPRFLNIKEDVRDLVSEYRQNQHAVSDGTVHACDGCGTIRTGGDNG